MDEARQSIEETLNYRFRQPAYLLEALTHPSYTGEAAAPVSDNQRLEFLGDAVLELAITDCLFRHFPQCKEGYLTKLRSVLAREEMLVRFARELSLPQCLRLGKGELQNGGLERESNLADAFEAVLGAMYLDGGLEPAQALCLRLIEPLLVDVESMLASENPKGVLQEYLQSHFFCKPDYEVLEIAGPGHRPDFLVRVTLQGEELARARAGSRRRAEREAARAALKRIRKAKNADEKHL